MSGFEPQTSGIGSNRTTNWATTTAQALFVYPQHILAFICGFAYVTNGILTIDGIQFFTFFLVLNIFRIISIVLPAALISWQV